MKKKIFFAIIFVFAGLFTISTSIMPSFAEDNFYSAPFQGLSLEYPDDWILLDDLPEPILVMFYVEDDLGLMLANIVVTSTPLDDNEMNSFQAAEELVDELKIDYPDLRVEQEGNIQISDYSSRQKIVSYESDFGQVKQDMIITVVDDSLYVFVLSTTPEDYATYQLIFNKILTSVEINPQTIPQIIDNNYENNEVGFKANFPPGWFSLESVAYDEYGIPMNIVMSVHPDVVDGDLENLAAVMIGHVENDSMTSVSYFDSLESSGCTLLDNNMYVTEFNSMKVIEFEISCIPEGFENEVDALGHLLLTDKNSFFVIYMASDRQFQDKLQEFENFKNTIQIQETIDLSNLTTVASSYDILFTQQEEKITDNVKTDLTLYENSTIKNFNFDMDSSTITFIPIGDDEGFFSMDIRVDEFLDEPYNVELDGDYSEFFIIHDNTTNQKFISIYTESPINEVKISGTLTDSLLSTSEISPIPEWVRTNAAWWAENQIDDATFVSGIQFLIKEGILSVPQTDSSDIQEPTSLEVPDWVKNNADWWAQGLLSDSDFIKGIQYLVEQGIILV